MTVSVPGSTINGGSEPNYKNRHTTEKAKARFYQETGFSSVPGTCQVSQSRCQHGKPVRKATSQVWQLTRSE